MIDTVGLSLTVPVGGTRKNCAWKYWFSSVERTFSGEPFAVSNQRERKRVSRKKKPCGWSGEASMSPLRALTRKVEPSRMLIVSLAMSLLGGGRCRTVARSQAALQASARRVPPVQEQEVSVRIAEERHVADPGVERLALELDSLCFERRPRFRHVRHTEREAAVTWRERLSLAG